MITRPLKIAFILVFIFHFSNILYKIVYPTTPGIRVHKTTLDKVTFPISLLVCANQIHNNSARYEKVGYPDYLFFYYGASKFNHSLFGWHGHTENGSFIAPVEGTLVKKKTRIQSELKRELERELEREL